MEADGSLQGPVSVRAGFCLSKFIFISRPVPGTTCLGMFLIETGSEISSELPQCLHGVLFNRLCILTKLATERVSLGFRQGRNIH